jgi:DNA-binding NarL/FixJ family response regulator
VNKTIEILLVDDYPFTIDGYTNYLKNFERKNLNLSFKIQSAVCCQTCIEILDKYYFDIIFLDIRIPSTNDNKFNSGEDIANYVKKKFPKTKVVVITGHFEPLILGNIIQTSNPIGLIYKTDFDQLILENLLTSILVDIPFYSSSILKLLRKNISSSIILTKTDKLLILEISKGKKTKELTSIVPLSIGGIEKRKRALKQLFGIPKANDTELIDSVIKKGFL